MSVLVLAMSWCMPRPAHAQSAGELFARGVTFQAFLDRAVAQREQWLTIASHADAADDVVGRIVKVGAGLSILVVAEDWCPDSVNVVPYVARLATEASIPLRIVQREAGNQVMRSHPASDGRPVTPTIVLLRDGRERGAWIERPAIVQQWFFSMATSPDSARKFEQRQAWYDADHGRTVIAEIAALIERTGPQK